ncbi:U1 snRNP protein [Malassezia vespertilionis]|uniref:U1 snRNP protein n=1 Tax=Malassezia vespertilionis TaxID=2020962 RepID=UPI0024B13E3D|nr:U1 snRNP protein [Malassezia vespertilionis]WFD05559.1 U1 snRNP protein [Malassezia vespertilionis]
MAGTPNDAASRAQSGSMHWVEYQNQEGRPYWYHTVERRSVWEKPTELKTARERAMEQTPWREYKSGVRSYYVHKDTKQSTWTMPEELKGTLPHSLTAALLDAIPEDAPASPDTGTPGTAHTPQSPADGNCTPINVGVRAVPRAPLSSAALFTNASDAEAAFIGLLRAKGIDETWTWEQTIREIVMEPMYRAFRTLAERKAAFNKYINELKTTEARRRSAKEAVLRPAMVKALHQSGGLKPYASYATFKKKLQTLPLWDDVDSDELAHGLYESIRDDVRKKEEAKERAVQAHNTEAFTALLKTIDMDATTLWRDVYSTILASGEYKHDARLQTMPRTEMLAIFEAHMRTVEDDARVFVDAEKRKKSRAARIHRDAFRALLDEHIASGSLTARSTWASFLPKIQHDPRLADVLTAPGSAPQQLLYDALDELERRFAVLMKEADAYVKQHSVSLDGDAWAQWRAALAAPQAPPALASLRECEQKEVLDELLCLAGRDARDARRRSDRKLRERADELRYALKKMHPPLDIDAPFERIVHSLEKLPEFIELKELEHDYRDLDDTTDERKRKGPYSNVLHEDPRAVRQRVRYDAPEARP